MAHLQKRPAMNASSSSADRFGRSVDSRVAAEHTEDMYERNNNEAIERLREKTLLVKSIALDIETEVQAQNRMLHGMGDDFSNTDSLLGGSMRRLKSLSNSPNGRLMWYLVAFCVFVFFVIYYLIR